MCYTVNQLLRYHRHCTANPQGQVLPPGHSVRWEGTMSGADWLKWFSECVLRKALRGTESTGKGNRARRRAQRMADGKARCKWCDALTGRKNRRFCCDSCASAYKS